jgi:hypothetical protein
MSDKKTPRTDEATYSIDDFFGRDGLPDKKVVRVKFAKTLEAENTRLREQVGAVVDELQGLGCICTCSRPTLAQQKEGK